MLDSGGAGRKQHLGSGKHQPGPIRGPLGAEVGHEIALFAAAKQDRFDAVARDDHVVGLKNPESALSGKGDVDSLAPPSDWPGIQALFVDWARERGLGPVLICRHIPQGPHFITVEPDSPYILVLDVKERGTFRGSTIIDAWSLPPLSQIDERGFRRVRPGVEGVIKLCMNGVRRGGLPNEDALRVKKVAELLRSDPDGMRLGATLLGHAAPHLIKGVAALLDGGWDRGAMRRVELWSAARAVAEPRTAISRWWFVNIGAKRCPVIRLIRVADRRAPGDDPQGWLRSVATDHELIEV